MFGTSKPDSTCPMFAGITESNVSRDASDELGAVGWSGANQLDEGPVVTEQSVFHGALGDLDGPVVGCLGHCNLLVEWGQ